MGSFAQQRIKKKKKTSEQGENFANKATDKGLISPKYKELMKLNIYKTNNPNSMEFSLQN